MPNSIKLRNFNITDFESVVSLWRDAGLPYRPKGRDRKEKIENELENDCSIFIVAEISNKIVGVVFGTHDGRKGWINRLAVHPKHRNKGIAKTLVVEVEKRLLDRGIEIMTCLIERDNIDSQIAFNKLGFKKWDDIVYFSKRMNPDV